MKFNKYLGMFAIKFKTQQIFILWDHVRWPEWYYTGPIQIINDGPVDLFGRHKSIAIGRVKLRLLYDLKEGGR